MSDPSRDHDLVVYGASGFVGTLLADYLAAHAPDDVRIALAGRSRGRVEAVRAGLPERARGWPVLVADSTDAAALAALASSTRVLATTVGPYARYGLPVVEACARAGTHYADLTGEVLFVRAAIDRCDALARETGARLVHSCGYDSIPSDLGTLLLHQRAAEDDAGALEEAELLASARGGFSGDTVASLLGQLETVVGDRELRRIAADPHALSPERAAEPAKAQPADAARPSRRPDGTWVAPFVMAPFNTRIVRRSNALQDWAYGRGLRYGEVMACGRGPAGAAVAAGVTAGLAAFVGAVTLPPTRALLERMLPSPGTGPSERTREKGWFRTVVHGRTERGRRYTVTVAGRGDPGYAGTAVMLGQSALCLVSDGDRLPDRAGSLTPATAMGSALIERLRAAGHTYDVAPA